ncbi:hypothetical protein NPX13_g7347 [Xylaria arbuscula]|uniref:Transmembrane protein n=1 Tax=Xylaria arbuscula TaxID=114810 RepID=A0A9W8NAH6_9PEZI|nr:hypothetical protein NPX13_g7347 [Xylaria arbuscula]
MYQTLTLLRSSTRDFIHIWVLAILALCVAILQLPDPSYLSHHKYNNSSAIITHEIVFSDDATPIASQDNAAAKIIDFTVVTGGDPQSVKDVCVSYDVIPFGILKRKRNVAGNKVAVVSIPQLPSGDWSTADVGVSPDGERVAVTGTSCAHLSCWAER